MDYTKFIIFFNSENVYLKISLNFTFIKKETRNLLIGNEIFRRKESFVRECFISSNFWHGGT